ncbi:MAG TPA: class I SAM-dependent methyltransferase [Dongiaceae bacterium]|jgi:2-polyprenyl-3-methyl-5-hydroxy-6-metoxy-1,4-benzoquinol methylase|nr:class I SAM-dependent methyltransferase [Dongiaceae bacterium]
MTEQRKTDVARFYDAEAAEYHQMYQRENLESSERYPANYFRLQILVRRLASLGAKRVYEIGVGEGSPLVAMAKLGLEVAGCDISEAMVAAARKNFAANGLSPDLVQWGDVEDATTMAKQLTDGKFDAVVAAGVLPHVRKDRLMLETVKMCLKPGGVALIEFRNKLFSLFTFNRLTKEFILDDLLQGVPSGVKAAVEAEIDRRCAVDQPTMRTAPPGTEVGYDEILARFHNPFELQNTFRCAGFSDVQMHWYHYHPAPPMMEGAIGPDFRRAAMRLEHEGSWRGMFLCSAGVIEARLPE